MRLINHSRFATRDLRRIFTRVGREELGDTPDRRMLLSQLFVVVREGAWGSAVSGTQIRMQVPNTTTAVQFAWFAARLCIAVRTRTTSYLPQWQAKFTTESSQRYAWAKDSTFMYRAAITKAPAPSPTKLASATHELKRAQKFYTRAEGRRQRSATTAKRWADVVQRLTRKVASLEQSEARKYHNGFLIVGADE